MTSCLLKRNIIKEGKVVCRAVLDCKKLYLTVFYVSNSEWKKNFLKIKTLVLIGGPDDGVITPWQSRWVHPLSFDLIYDFIQSANVKLVQITFHTFSRFILHTEMPEELYHLHLRHIVAQTDARAKMPLSELTELNIVHTLLSPDVEIRVFLYINSIFNFKASMQLLFVKACFFQCDAALSMLRSHTAQLWSVDSHVMLTRYVLLSLSWILVSLDFMTTTRPSLRCSTKMWAKVTLQTHTHTFTTSLFKIITKTFVFIHSYSWVRTSKTLKQWCSLP